MIFLSISEISDPPLMTSSHNIMEEIAYQRFSRDLIMMESERNSQETDNRTNLKNENKSEVPIYHTASTRDDNNSRIFHKNSQLNKKDFKVSYITMENQSDSMKLFTKNPLFTFSIGNSIFFFLHRL